MAARDTELTTDQKALAINLDKFKFGSIVEIGAGQEVARRFFSVGAAAGTVAKTMSAYDMAVSDDIYGPVDRYVSRARLMQMLDKEFSQVVNRLTDVRPRNSTFFAYAATVTARSFKQQNECHGWVGIRAQFHPGAAPSDIVLHVRMLDQDNAQQADALGILGVNLIHAAFYYHNRPEDIIDSLRDELGTDRIEVDVVHFSGPYFEEVDNRRMNVQLIRSWLTRAVIFNPDGNVVVPGELFFRKPVLVIRGLFKPVTKVNADMMLAGQQQFDKLAAVDHDDTVSLAEVTMSSPTAADETDDADLLERADLLAALGYTVMISDYVRFFRLRAYLRRYTQKPIGIVLSVRDFGTLFDEKYYEGVEGGILEAFGKLFPDNTQVYVYPSRRDGETETTTLHNVQVPGHLRHLLAHLVENGKLQAVEPTDESWLHIDAGEVLHGVRQGRGAWEEAVPAPVAETIIQRRLLGFDRD
ncbi:TonB-dependent receptor [Aquisalimonas sp. 2447]|uniref:TonB-dependent receptor n=1 Tax=Aquisalimonas sp. 2447 TaxID=2740807 RepID=UPI00143252D3|nr:TonB-dependent receptor [Aquisalimonas sp. 2447]QIT54278.1 TonB-dependent receptor [Aquisalimonas sp. 2447]